LAEKYLQSHKAEGGHMRCTTHNRNLRMDAFRNCSPVRKRQVIIVSAGKAANQQSGKDVSKALLS